MPIHVKANPDDIAKIVILPGNPQRTEYIAKKFLSNTKIYSDYRLMYGITGEYKGKKISIQTTGMGSPSISIVIEELNMLGVKSLIRLGTTGAMQEGINHADLILPTAAHSSHNIFSDRFKNSSFSAVPDFIFNQKLYENSKNYNFKTHTGPILTSETFYSENEELYDLYKKYNTLAVEMECYSLFGLSMKYKIKSAALLTVSDTISTKERAAQKIIQNGVDKMTELALDTIVDNYDYLVN